VVDHVGGRDLEVELSVSPTWAILPVVRNFVEQALSRSLQDTDLAYRLSMATHELFENAVKYASSGPATLRVSVDTFTRHAWIALSNQSDAAHIEDLEKQFAEMATSSDPVNYYCEMMRRHSKRKDVSRLGLARIQAEGNMRLSLATTAAGVVTIRAESPPAVQEQP
jgi:hypothetical protein